MLAGSVGAAQPATGAAVTAERSVLYGWIVVLLVLSLTGCSVSSRPSIPENMTCIRAHDEYHEGRAVTICDEYEQHAGQP